MEWVVYIFENLQGDSSCLALTTSPIASPPHSNRPPPGDDVDPSTQPGHEEVLFDGNLNDILGGTFCDAMEQEKVLEPEDRVEIDLEINNQDWERHGQAEDMVIYD